MKYFLVRQNFIFVCLLLFVVFPKGLHNVSHEFLLLYIGDSMKSRRSQCMRNLIQYRKLNRFLQRSRKAMTVNIYLAIQ